MTIVFCKDERGIRLIPTLQSSPGLSELFTICSQFMAHILYCRITSPHKSIDCEVDTVIPVTYKKTCGKSLSLNEPIGEWTKLRDRESMP